jgi:hypothetical protein
MITAFVMITKVHRPCEIFLSYNTRTSLNAVSYFSMVKIEMYLVQEKII